MAATPPGSPLSLPPRPASAIMRPLPRTNSRMSTTSKAGGRSRASDEDGKTSVRVAVRVRPPLKSTDPGFELIPQRFQRSMVQVTSPTGLSIDSPQGKKLFVFDRVFSEEVNQEGIWDYLADSTSSFVQGYNVSMLAYGQSGAGKSYTMGTSGPSEQGDLDVMGVIPRAATALFEKLEGPRPTNNRNSMSGLRAPARYSANPTGMSKPVEKSWTLKATYVEIYNEQLRDLLVPDHVPQHERGAVTIREDVKGHILLTGLHQVDINSVDDLMAALNLGSSIRQTDATAINAKSSRSHAVFSLNLIQRKTQSSTRAEKRFSVPLEAMSGTDAMVTVDSKLHFVDLAGSERLKNTGAQGDRAKEGISINAGLASLGKVISQLSSRQAGSHVSYRDSKLTRLLQDSLGGNAITYMIACVTPAEFHLSETLNTVQYAQRARAIQSKPRIQQTSDDSDKVAMIERLKAEVAFLRDQIRSTEHGSGGERNRIGHTTTERSERQNEREVELQNQLLDTQENYTTLSQRHAKLISEMAKARDGELSDNQAFENTLGDSATERLKRSNSFAEAVEQVVLEYEKTIQSLEQSLSSTRSNLSNIETILLEKETNCAYVETVNQQLQARLQKLVDRESTTEHYLHDLEAKLDGHTSGEEKNSAIVMELRKEITRVRENEATCEDYISTLEERLAEADQDSELMQREIDRLEHVVERQWSLGKLDNLLYELDHIQQGGNNFDAKSAIASEKRTALEHSRQQSLASKRGTQDIIMEAEDEESHLSDGNNSKRGNQDIIMEAEDEESHLPDGNNSKRSELEGPVDNGEPIDGEPLSEVATTVHSQAPAQSKFVEDKLENVTQELLGLKMEHEATITELDTLSAKYEEAMLRMAELQDAVDESRYPTKNRDSLLSMSSPTTYTLTKPTSFLADARVNELREGKQYSSSRSLSLELSSAGELPGTMETSDAEAAIKESESGDVAEEDAGDDTIAVEVESLRRLAAEKEQAQQLLTAKYAELEEEHEKALDLVEELKSDIARAKMNESSSPTTSFLRRKSSQNVMVIDRAHRAFATLRNIASESFENNPDVMANFELNLNAAMHELHTRSERVQKLEADITAVKKEMETKAQIISGLTRERSSLKASPMDISVLMQSQTQMKLLQDAHAARERELQAEVEGLRASVTSHVDAKNGNLALSEELKGIQDKKISDLETELTDWQGRHQAALTSMQTSEQHLVGKIAQLEEQLSTMTSQAFGVETIDSLQREIEEHKAAVVTNTSRVVELEHAYASTREQLDEVTKARDHATSQADHHKSIVSRLEQQIVEHGNVVKMHQEDMNLLRDNHAKEIEQFRSSFHAGQQAHLATITSAHQESITTLEDELLEARDELTKVATQVAFALGVDVSTVKLQERISDILADQQALSQEQKKSSEMGKHVIELSAINDKLMQELEAVKAEVTNLLLQTADGAKNKTEHTTISEQLAALKMYTDNLEEKNKKNSRMIEELEDQLASNFDQHQHANNRLSTLQTQRDAALSDAKAAHVTVQGELEAIREEYASLQAKLIEVQGEPIVNGTQRSNSQNGLRKTASVSSMPSPPPSMPLPPIPGTTSPTNIPPTPTQANRPNSKELALAQIQEDQEARIRTIEKHLFAEKQLTTTLEEALTDLERQSNKLKTDCDGWRKRASELQSELEMAKERARNAPEQEHRWSMLQVEEERKKRRDAELARAHLEERMNAISKKKKKGSLNCF
ncbi:putative chromosome-associated kinesin KIF4B [Calycina marina]|uniref:Chromosome-associated kinesin KIF4B n=1 Tax=Calycina marina TaxID=1763456 RepID=A0A9P7Z1L3_9HELO|nr:putative chromosome-associated kinesin KIF4B [Calycina marina]